MANINELREQLKEKLEMARGIAVKAEQEDRDFTADEREQIRAVMEEAADLKAKLKQLESDEQLKNDLRALAGIEGSVPENQGSRKSIGEKFVTDPAWQNWLKSVAPSGVLNDRMRVQSPPVKFGSLFGQKAVVTGASDTSAGAFVETDYTGIYEPIGRWPLSVRDLISVRQTTSDLVSFVRQTTQVTQATPVQETNVTTYTGSTGEISGKKPEGNLEFTPVTAPVRTVAVWIPVTKRALSDAAQVRSLIDQELRDDVNEELENQIFNGDGTGENFTGLDATAGTLLQAYNTDILTTTRQAVTTLAVTGRTLTPTAWVFHPSDWETVELLQDANNRYYYAGPLNQGPPRLWGIPIVQSFFVPAGTAWLADWRKAVLWDRQQASISVSDSHEDFFIRNMVAILCELRAAFGVTKPQAFIKVDLTPGS